MICSWRHMEMKRKFKDFPTQNANIEHICGRDANGGGRDDLTHIVSTTSGSDVKRIITETAPSFVSSSRSWYYLHCCFDRVPVLALSSLAFARISRNKQSPQPHNFCTGEKKIQSQVTLPKDRHLTTMAIPSNNTIKSNPTSVTTVPHQVRHVETAFPQDMMPQPSVYGDHFFLPATVITKHQDVGGLPLRSSTTGKKK